MKFPTAGWIVSFLFTACTLQAAAPPANNPATAGADTPSVAPAKSRTFPYINPPPLPPVEQFNHLLRASPADRTNQLVGKSEASRDVILRALAQFDALPAAEQEERILQLRVAQLRFFLRPLLRAKPEDRRERLNQIPLEDRIMVSNRLSVWDQLPASTRQEVLEKDEVLQRFVRVASAHPTVPTTNILVAVVPSEVQQSWDHWQSLPPEERGRREANFQRFFDLTPDEQIRAIDGLPAAERQRMEYALKKFNEAPPAKRDSYVRNFDRLARLPEAERAEFLRNAAKWKAMTQAERDAWRRLLFSVPPPPMPPIPPTVAGGAK